MVPGVPQGVAAWWGRRYPRVSLARPEYAGIIPRTCDPIGFRSIPKGVLWGPRGSPALSRAGDQAGSAPQWLTNSKAVVDAVVNGPSAHRRASVRMEVCARWVSVYRDYVSFLGFD